MKQIRKLLQPHLYTRSYFQVAPADAQVPYVTYDITQVTDDGEGTQIAVIDIDGWDMPNNSDTTVLEDLMANINQALNKKVLEADGMALVLYLDRKMALIDTDPRIKRRKYIYQARIIGRS